MEQNNKAEQEVRSIRSKTINFAFLVYNKLIKQ